jgi:hypothetical protein
MYFVQNYKYGIQNIPWTTVQHQRASSPVRLLGTSGGAFMRLLQLVSNPEVLGSRPREESVRSECGDVIGAVGDNCMDEVSCDSRQLRMVS